MSDDVIYGDKEYKPYAPLYPTPAEIPLDTACWSISLPNGPAWWGLLFGAILYLTDPENFQVFEGGLSRETTADIFDNALLDAWEELSCVIEVPAPYWDDNTDGDDADDESPPDSQLWYGFIDTDSDFQANLENVFLASFVAQIAALTSGPAAGLAAAVEFLTIAKAYRLAFRTGDWGGIVDIFVDLTNVGTIDTYSATPGLTYIDIIIPEA